MSAGTKIEWTDATWNPVTGCSKVSPGCKHCYAERMAKRLAGRCGYPADDHFRVTLHPDRLEEPLRWRQPRWVFVCSMSDLFHPDVPVEFIAEVFDVMACATAACGKRHRHEEECWTGPAHTFQILTKRPERMRQVLAEELPNYVGHYWPGDRPLCVSMDAGAWPLPNVWIGTSVENQEAADERVPSLLATPAVVRFVSCEPLLGPVDLRPHFPQTDYCPAHDYGDPGYPPAECAYCKHHPGLDWVIVGGESGPDARPMHPDWVRSIRDQCQAAGVPFFFKQWGEWTAEYREEKYVRLDLLKPDEQVAASKYAGHVLFRRVGKKRAGRLLDGRTWDEMPRAVQKEAV